MFQEEDVNKFINNFPFVLVYAILLTGFMSQRMTTKQFRPKETFQFTENVRINFEKKGRQGPSVIFLHGFGASLISWCDIKDALPSGFQYYFLDLKGFGHSSKPKDGKYSILDQAEIVTEFILRNNLEHVILVGHSYGGGIALYTHMNFHTKKLNPIKKIILIDSAGYTLKFPFFIDYLRTPVINVLMLNLVPTKLRAEKTLKKLFHDDSKVTKKKVLQYSFFFDMQGSHNSFIQAAKQILPKNYGEVIEHIKLIDFPTLIVWGRDDPIIPVSDAYRFGADINDVQVKIVDNCGHVPHEEKPKETALLIGDFLTKR